MTKDEEIQELRASLKEMLDAYWGKGDGEPPPAFIGRATALAAGTKSCENECDGVGG